MKKIDKIILTIACALIALSFLTGIFYLAQRGYYTRLIADDYCSLASLKNYGFWKSQSHYYLNWSGRYTFTFLILLFQSFGIWFIKFTPALLAIIWIFINVSLLNEVFNGKLFKYLLSTTLSATIVFLSIYNAPDILQSFYWQTGALTYTLPLIGASSLFLVLLKFWNSKKHIYLFSIASFITAYFLVVLLKPFQHYKQFSCC